MISFRELYIDDYRIRRATLDDVATVIAIYHADDGAHVGFQVATEALLQAQREKDGSNLALDAWIAETFDGQIVATADVSSANDGGYLSSSVAVDAAHAGRGLEDALASLVQTRARQISGQVGADACACPVACVCMRRASLPTTRVPSAHVVAGPARERACACGSRAVGAGRCRRGRGGRRGPAPLVRPGAPSCADATVCAEGSARGQCVRVASRATADRSRVTSVALVLDLAWVRARQTVSSSPRGAYSSRVPRVLALCA